MDKKYILYVNMDCPFCKKAVSLLEKNDENFSILNLKKRPRVLQELKEIYNWYTVPMVFERRDSEIKFIGGFTDLSERLTNV